MPMMDEHTPEPEHPEPYEWPDNVTWLFGAQPPDPKEPPSPAEILAAVGRVTGTFALLAWMVGLTVNMLKGMLISRAISESIALTVPYAVVGAVIGAAISVIGLWLYYR